MVEVYVEVHRNPPVLLELGLLCEGYVQRMEMMPQTMHATML
jgi:hypothetical protein